MSQLSGWAGRAADILNSSYNTGSAFMSVSLSGNNILQVGSQTQQFVLNPGNGLAFTGDSGGVKGNPLQLKNDAFRSILDQQYSNLLTESFSRITRQSDLDQQTFQAHSILPMQVLARQMHYSCDTSGQSAEGCSANDQDSKPAWTQPPNFFRQLRRLGPPQRAAEH